MELVYAHKSMFGNSNPEVAFDNEENRIQCYVFRILFEIQPDSRITFTPMFIKRNA
jgi:hypothetical protein